MALATIVAYQNCDGGFSLDRNTGELSSLSTGGGGTLPTTIPTTGPYGLKTYGPGGAQLADATVIDTALDYTLMAGGTGVTSAILTWSINSAQNTANCSLSSTGSNYSKVLRCLTAGQVQVRAEAIWADGTNTVAFVNRTVQIGNVNPGATPTNPNLIEFRIRSGTGNGPWNTSATAVVVFVGQTLKITNDDTTPHRLRTGGTPCADQPANMATGAFYDCVIAAAQAPTATNMYDFNAGTAAIFYVNAIDGATQYARPVSGQSCATCHNAIGASTKRGASFTAIKTAITTNRGNMGIYNGQMTDDEIRAIAYRLR